MKTLDYLHLDASAVSNVVASLKQLLADYQVFYTNLSPYRSHWMQMVSRRTFTRMVVYIT